MVYGRFVESKISGTGRNRSVTPTFEYTYGGVVYNADKQNSISLTLDNLLNREDNLSHSGSEYYSTPFNFLLSYNYKF